MAGGAAFDSKKLDLAMPNVREALKMGEGTNVDLTLPTTDRINAFLAKSGGILGSVTDPVTNPVAREELKNLPHNFDKEGLPGYHTKTVGVNLTNVARNVLPDEVAKKIPDSVDAGVNFGREGFGANFRIKF